GDGTFAVKQTFTFLVDPEIPDAGTFPVTSVQVTSFRGNGTLDILANTSVLLGKGDGTFQDPAASSGPAAVTVGDFNADGKHDIVISNSGGQFGSPSLTVRLGNGDGTFQAPKTVNLGETANALAAGDFRGAGTLDLVLASSFGANT